MVRLVLTWVCIPFAIAACAYLNESTHRPTTWERACAAVESSYQQGICEELDEPQVVVSSVPLIVGAYGIYMKDEKIVYVLTQEQMDAIGAQNWVTAPRQVEVIFHEIIHYILDFGAEKEVTRCESESIARHLTAAEFGKKVDPKWRATYGCSDPRSVP